MAEGLREQKMEQERVLSFEEFTGLTEMGFPRYNNFWFFFVKRDLLGSKLYIDKFLEDEDEETDEERETREMNKKCYETLAEKNPDLAKRLCEEIQNCKDLKSGKLQEKLAALKRFEKDMHDAYLIMKECGATDYELFR